MKKILITGGAGFIGFTIASILALDQDNMIDIVDDLSKGEKDDELRQLLKNKNVMLHELDLTRPDTFTQLRPEYDQIYHLAAVVGVSRVNENPDSTIKVNTLSTIYLLEHIKKMKNKPTILFTSSCENYAGSIRYCNVPIPTPEDIPLCIEDIYNPRWSYAASKILGEIACIHYANKYGFNSIVVRYHNIYGPRMGTSHVIPEFIIRLKKDPRTLELHGGYQYRSFCYVLDAAKMTISLMNNERSYGKVVNIGNDRDIVKISDIADILSELMDISPELVEHGAPDGSTHKRIPDLGLIRRIGSYVSEVPFSQGLVNTYEWYNRHL